MNEKTYVVTKLNDKYGIEVYTKEFGWVFLSDNGVIPLKFDTKEECKNHIESLNIPYVIINNYYNERIDLNNVG